MNESRSTKERARKPVRVNANLSKTAVRAERQRSQRLRGNPTASPRDAVAWMGAVQAQDFNAAQWAVGIRTADGSSQTVLEAFNAGEILRTHVLRPTWHLVTAENIRWMCALSAPKVKAALQASYARMGLSDALHEQASAAIVSALEGGKQLAARELGEILEANGIDTANNRMYHYLMYAEADALICSGPLRGKTQTYALLDERVPPTAALSREESIARLAQIYLQSHAPLSLEDFCWWSSLPKTEARKAIETLDDVEKIELDGQTIYRLKPQDEQAPTPTKRSSVLLLPAFDEYLVAYSNRDAVIAKEHQPQAITSNGIFRPTIVANGKVVGTWRKGSSAKRPLEFNYFQTPGATLEKQVEKAAKRFLAFKEVGSAEKGGPQSR